MKEIFRKKVSRILAVVMMISTFYVPQSANVVNATTSTLSNPRIIVDNSMKAGQKVTWDTITFGFYPQSEVASDDEIYAKLVAATEWDDNEEITIDGKKYRRMLKEDATFAPQLETPCYYQWKDESTYHYFVYEPVKWRVLQVQDNKALILSDMVLDNQLLYSTTTASVWDKSQVRSWLNGYGSDMNAGAIDYSNNNFIDSAFSEEEQLTIIQYTEEEIADAYVGSGMEDDTTDKLFLLSATEVYLNEEAASYGFVRDKNVYDEARWCHSSDYAKAQGTYMGDSNNYADNCMWWLRASGSAFSKAACVYDSGMVSSTSNYKIQNVGIRVALTLDLSQDVLYAYSGTVCSDEYKIAVQGSGEKTEGELCNPRIDADNSMNAGSKTTWDCVWFGSYPQTQITKEDEIYVELESAEEWDANGDIIINGIQYHRMLKGESRATTFNTTNSDSATNYYWGDDTTYHYFRYDPIKWRVLSIEDNRAYLVSDKVLDYYIFGGTTIDNPWWERSVIRSWLNGYSATKNSDKIDYSKSSFLERAFEDYEEEAIVSSTISERAHSYYGTLNGADLTNKIHMLSETEVCGMELAVGYGFGAVFSIADESRSALCTTYAKAMGLVSEESGQCNYWLRSTPEHGSIAIQVEASGNVDNRGVSPKKYAGVRPTLYIDLNRESVYTYAGEVSSDGVINEVEYTGTSGEENGGLSNPAISLDDSLKAGQKVTWDCVTFGSYPQSEMTKEDTVYETLLNSAEWDEDDNITIDGIRYHRIMAKDALYVRDTDYTEGYYYWENDTTYHYFKYEPIKWRVLRVDNNQALLLSDIALDNQSFYAGTSCTWETSTLRNWLNGYEGQYVGENFIDSAFSQEEQNVIIPYNASDACDGIEEENAIIDKVYILSSAEVSSSEKATKYGFINGTIGGAGTVDEARRCHSSDYAKAKGTYSISSSVYEKNCFWWTRSCSATYGTVSTVADNGCVVSQDCEKKNVAVRVAINVDLSENDLYSHAGTVSSIDNIQKTENSGEESGNVVSNPRITSDYSTISGKKTTWDCVWYGEYPQSEITSDEELYERLVSSTDWNEQGDITIENTKYRRLLEGEIYRYFQYEPVKWRVLQTDGKQMLLLADVVLDVRGMDENYTTQAWDVSTMRSWLNGKDETQNRDGIDFTKNSFIGTALSKEEQTYVVKSKVDCATSMYCIENEIDCGKNTLDYLFLLADSEVYGTKQAQAYGFDGSFIVRDEARNCKGSEYVQAKGLSVSTIAGKTGYVEWWTRTQGHSQKYVASVNSSGEVEVEGIIGKSGVRPAMYVSLEDNSLYSYAGIVCSDATEVEENRPDEGKEPGEEGPGEGEETGGNEETGGGEETGGNEETGGGEETGGNEETGDSEENDGNEGTGGTEGGDDIPLEEEILDEISLVGVTATTIVSQPYCGQPITPIPVLTYKDTTLVERRDYTLTYQNNVNVGKAQILVTGCGNYTGTKTITFDITPFDASNLSTTLKGKDGNIYRATYTKKSIKLKTAFKIATTNNGEKVYLQPKEGTDYTVQFKNNKKIGTASIIYTFKGNYTGVLTKNFQIVPPTTKVTSVKKSGAKLVIKWKKVSSCDHYEVYRATTKNGKYKKLATVKGKNKCTYTDKKAKKGKTYYYKVKACKKVKKTVYKSDFSNAKKGKR